MLSISTLIWIACRPLIRLVFCVSCGILVTKQDIFPLVAARSVSQIILNVGYPCLMFSKIVPAFTADNLPALGPLILVAVIYMMMGFLLGFVIKQFCWLPHRFRYGILTAGAFSNVGDIPMAVALAITASAPFRGPQDQNLAVAYISTFLLIFMVTLFPLGAHRLIVWDYTGPDVEWEEARAKMRDRRPGNIIARWRGKTHTSNAESRSSPEEDIEKQSNETPEMGEKQLQDEKFVVEVLETSVAESPRLASSSNPRSDISTCMEVTTLPPDGHVHTSSTAHAEPIDASPTQRSRRRYASYTPPKALIVAIRSFFSPPTISILISFPIALIPPLKALFVSVPNSSIPAAPDGQPPLAFIMDATSFVGGAAVPMALITLGSSLARLAIPKRGEWRKLPLGAIGFLAAGKLVLMPVLGILICQGLTKAGVISKDDKVLRFVCIFCSCLPTATTQVFLTQVYSGDGSAEHISVFLIPQYFLMFLTMTTLTAYTLHLLS